MAELIALLLATLTGLLGHGASDVELARQVEAALKAKMPVPMDEVAASCEGVTASGVEQLSFDITGLLLDPLLIGQAVIKISDVTLQPDKKISLSAIDWTADIGEQPLTDTLRTHVDKLSDATVDIKPEGITLSGTYPMLLGIRVPYTVTGDLVVEQQTQLMFRIRKSGVSGVKLPGGLNKLIENEINPVYDLAKFAARSKKDIERAKKQLNYSFMLKVAELKPADGHIIVSGSA